MGKKRFIPLLALGVLSLSSCGQVVHYEDIKDSYIEKMSYHTNFHVLQLSDIHWNINTENNNSRRYLAKVLKETNAKCANQLDLIEVVGDTFMLANASYVKDFISFMEEQCALYNTRYAITWGNHDHEGTYNAKWLTKQFKKASHCIYIEPENDDLSGRGNFVINLMEGDTVKWQIANVDSGATNNDSPLQFFRDYDYIRDDQYDWLSLLNKNANNAPVIAYYHIPQKDNQIIYDKVVLDNEPIYNKFFKLESFAECGNEEKGGCFIDETQTRGINLKGCFMSHAHSVDWTADYKGVTIGLGVKSGKELYYAQIDKDSPRKEIQDGLKSIGMNESFDLIGGSLVTLHDDETFALEHLYLNERDGSDFVKWVNYHD